MGLQARTQALQEDRGLAGNPESCLPRHRRPSLGPACGRPLPMAAAALDGFREVGLPVLDDLNGEREITGNGFAYMNQIIKEGRRHSMARAFLYPVLTREDVTVLVNTQVNRVLLKRNHAVGVDCVRNGQSQTFRAHREVILSTGGFNTPKLLMLSGIGNEKELRAVDVPVRMHSPEVGKNVQDHILILHADACSRRPSRSGTATAPPTCRAISRPTPGSSCRTSAWCRSSCPTPARSSPPSSHRRPTRGPSVAAWSRPRAAAR
jgi:choline dehydrogenase-like flavoprotein